MVLHSSCEQITSQTTNAGGLQLFITAVYGTNWNLRERSCGPS